ncbi:homoserine kinase [Alkalibacterium sp. m-11]
MSEKTFKIPATSANLGLGFDSIGVAVDKFLTVTARPADDWQFHFKKKSLEVLPSGEKNMVVEMAQYVAKEYGKEMPRLEIDMDSEIPLAHGLGSSSSALVAGIELANHYLDLNLSTDDKVRIGTAVEKHPDNIGPCLTGGVFVGFYEEEKMAYYTMRLEGISLIVSVPSYEIMTEEARAALPESYNRQTAVSQNAKNNVMLLAMANQDYTLMGELMMDDQFHELYRSPLIAEHKEIKDITLKNGAYATVISGAGPTLLTLCPEEKADQILEQLSQVSSCSHEQVNVFYKD